MACLLAAAVARLNGSAASWSVKRLLVAPRLDGRGQGLRGPVDKAGTLDPSTVLPARYAANCRHSRWEPWFKGLETPNSPALPQPCQDCQIWVSMRGALRTGRVGVGFVQHACIAQGRGRAHELKVMALTTRMRPSPLAGESHL